MVRIRAFVMDVDGTMTDGKIYTGLKGEVFKAFDVHDGYAICDILPQYGVVPVILSGRFSHLVDNRAKELRIEGVYQGVSDKRGKLFEIAAALGLQCEETAYIGDDLADYEAMQLAGVRGCPKNAVRQIREMCEYVSEYDGGNGAIRDFVEWLVDNGYIIDESPQGLEEVNL